MSEIDPQSTDVLPSNELSVKRIVIAVVLILLAAIAVAILGPIFAAARGQASDISCLSNVKQLCLATQMYAQDYDEHLPNAKHWIDQTLPYSKKDEAVYRCPVVKRNSPGDYGYAMNSKVSMTRTEDIKAPERTPLLYDTGVLYRNACAPDLMGLSRPGRHNDHWDNIGYADGHAKAVRVDQKP